MRRGIQTSEHDGSSGLQTSADARAQAEMEEKWKEGGCGTRVSSFALMISVWQGTVTTQRRLGACMHALGR